MWALFDWAGEVWHDRRGVCVAVVAAVAVTAGFGLVLVRHGSKGSGSLSPTSTVPDPCAVAVDDATRRYEQNPDPDNVSDVGKAQIRAAVAQVRQECSPARVEEFLATVFEPWAANGSSPPSEPATVPLSAGAPG